MSETSEGHPIREEDFSDDKQNSSPWTMLFTMLLLIAGFLFASVLLMHQTRKAKTQDGKPIFQLSLLVEKGKALTTRPTPSETNNVTELTESHSSPLQSLKQMVQSQTSDRWPRLKMTGFGKSTDGSEGFAIINGNLVHPGEYTGKVKLLEVRTHDVVVEYKDATKTLTVEMEQ